MKQILMAVACACSFVMAHAQTTIKGKVIDAASNNPIAGATISISGKGQTSTDKDGLFSIGCEGKTKISVSSIGYETEQQTVKNCNEELLIALVPVSRSLNEVEITATSAQNKSILYQPSSITKLNERELKRGTGLFLDDAINVNVPGVIMQRRAVSSGQQFNIRGYGNGINGTRGISSNFDVQGTKVYLNGIPITDAEGITVMDDIDFGSIGNVEVVKGPAGTLYGLAIAGVVNLKTVKPEKGKTSIGQDVLIGNYGLQRYTTHFEMGGERSSLLANYGYQKSDGAMAHNASTKRFVNLAGDFQINNKQSVTTYFGYSNSYDERGGELTLDQYANKDYSGNTRYIQRNAHSNIVSFRGGLGHTFNFNDHISNTTTVFGSGATNNSSSAAGWTDKNPFNFGLRSTFDTKFSLSNDINVSGITGVETQKQYAQIIGYNMIANPNDPNGYFIIEAIKSNQATTTATTSLFTEWNVSLPQNFSITAGIGYSNMDIELNDKLYVPNKRTSYDISYKNMFSPHVAINKIFNKQVSVYASYSKGYKAPVSSIFFIPSTNQLNAGLKPEVGNQFEIGTKGSLLNNRLSYQLAVFDAIFSDKMAAVPVTQGNTTLYSYVANSGKQNNKGIEALVKYTAYESSKSFVSLVRPFANFTYSDFTYDDYVFASKNYDGKKVAGVPPVSFNAGVDVNTLPGIYANAYYTYRGDVYITSDNDEAVKAKHFGLLNAKLGLRRSLSDHFDIDVFFGANNITGTQYYNMIFVNQIPDAYLPAPLKAVYFGGINLKYNF
ncbi:MAG: TonB-dependent receptor [Flavisolibacter sp.]|jgi:iron complex outermembrane receptor protein